MNDVIVSFAIVIAAYATFAYLIRDKRYNPKSKPRFQPWITRNGHPMFINEDRFTGMDD